MHWSWGVLGISAKTNPGGQKQHLGGRPKKALKRPVRVEGAQDGGLRTKGGTRPALRLRGSFLRNWGSAYHVHGKPS